MMEEVSAWNEKQISEVEREESENNEKLCKLFLFYSELLVVPFFLRDIPEV